MTIEELVKELEKIKRTSDLNEKEVNIITKVQKKLKSLDEENRDLKFELDNIDGWIM